MPGFLAEWVAKGFWWALLANALVGIVFGSVGKAVQKFNKIVGAIILYVPNALFLFYIWHVRGAVGWLIAAIIVSVLTLIVIIIEAIPLILEAVAGGLSSQVGPVSAESLQRLVESLNPSLPTMIDQNTRHDSYTAGPGLRLTSTFTLVTLSANDPGMDEVKTNMYNALLGVVRTTAAFSHYREAGVVMVYEYKDKNGMPFATYEFGPNVYR